MDPRAKTPLFALMPPLDPGRGKSLPSATTSRVVATTRASSTTWLCSAVEKFASPFANPSKLAEFIGIWGGTAEVGRIPVSFIVEGRRCVLKFPSFQPLTSLHANDKITSKFGNTSFLGMDSRCHLRKLRVSEFYNIYNG
jgi:hypothetical protein